MWKSRADDTFILLVILTDVEVLRTARQKIYTYDDDTVR